MGRKVTTLEEASDVYITGSICLTDIPKELITTGKNGKRYLSIALSRQPEIGRFGDSHTIKAKASKDQKAAGIFDKFIGNGVQWVNDDVQTPVANNGDAPAASADKDDSLPW